jgi:thiamine biosynthesis protein ThiI
MERSIVCHYHEIALKKKNRTFFEEQLCKNIRKGLGDLEHGPVERRFGRIVVRLSPDAKTKELEDRLGHVFGINSYSPAWICESNIDTIETRLWDLIAEREFESFKIHARRADKTFPLQSPEINRRLGALVVKKTGKRVRLEAPDLTCYVHIVGNTTYLYFDRFRGAGGLPVGASGRVAVLLSGGIDSPVAAYKILRRGCRATFVHFHSFPHTSLESQDKVRQLAAILNRYQHRAKLFMVPFAETQRQIVALTPPESRVVLYRRMMVRIAQRIALRDRAKALITGDSIGQVASQTLENIQVISEAASRLPILRPLVGEDKEDIISAARSIGTFETSIVPDDDCCSLFVPRHPVTRARLEDIQRAETELDTDLLVRDALRNTELEKIEFGDSFDVRPTSPNCRA